MKKILFLLLSLFLLYSCDVLTPTGYFYIKDTLSNSNIDTNEVVKKVLLIDFTGIRCVNCPEAHETIHQIQSVHPGKVIAVAIHGTSLAYPVGEYTTDLRTDDGNEIILEFGISAIPIGLVDYFDKNHLTSLTTWTDEVDNELLVEPEIGIEIQNSLNEITNQVQVSVDITSLSNFQESLKLAVFIVEDSIITRQATEEAPGYIENYVQMNVFRDAISNVWGDEIFVSGAEINESENKTYTFSLNTEWNYNNCRIIAFVFNQNNLILNAYDSYLK